MTAVPQSEAVHSHVDAATRLRANRLGLWLFLASETFLFSAVITARYYLAGLERPEELNLPLGLAVSAVLLLSSYTAYRADMAIARGDRAGFLRFTQLTILLGVLFLGGVALEWDEGLHAFPPSTPYGSAFFTLIGFHAFHLLTGLIALGIVLLLGRRGHFSARDRWPVEAVMKYWEFVDVMWIFIFATLYLVS